MAPAVAQRQAVQLQPRGPYRAQVLQHGRQHIGCGDGPITGVSGATGGQFELNIMMPVMGLAIVESIDLLSASVKAFINFCALEMEANREACEKQVEWSMAMVTSLNPLIGYEMAAVIAKEAFKVGKTVRDLCLEKIKAGTLKKKPSRKEPGWACSTPPVSV